MFFRLIHHRENKNAPHGKCGAFLFIAHLQSDFQKLNIKVAYVKRERITGIPDYASRRG